MSDEKSDAAGAGPALGIGLTPDATAFGRLFVTARWARWSAEIAADAALPETLEEPDGNGVVVSAMGEVGELSPRGPGVESPFAARRKSKTPRANSLDVLRKPSGRPGFRKRKKLPESNPLRYNSLFLDFRNLLADNGL